MSSPGPLPLTGSWFTLPLTIIGAGLTLVGWLMRKLADRLPASTR